MLYRHPETIDREEAFPVTELAALPVSYAPDQRQARHAHEMAQITLVLRGGLVERVGRTEERAGPLSIVFKPAGLEHANDYGRRGADTFTILLRGEAAARLTGGVSGLQQWRWLHASAAARSMLRLFAHTPHCGRSLTPDDALLVDVLAALTDVTGTPDPGTPPAWLRRTRQHIDDDIFGGDGSGVAFRVADIAREAGVHPVYLARCFRRWYGCSVNAYQQRARLRRAATLMEDDLPLTRIAYRAGYADQAHFCRHFRRSTGMTASRYRRVVGMP